MYATNLESGPGNPIGNLPSFPPCPSVNPTKGVAAFVSIGVPSPSVLREIHASKKLTLVLLYRRLPITKPAWYLACPANPNFFSQSTFEPICLTRDLVKHI